MNHQFLNRFNIRPRSALLAAMLLLCVIGCTLLFSANRALQQQKELKLTQVTQQIAQGLKAKLASVDAALADLVALEFPSDKVPNQDFSAVSIFANVYALDNSNYPLSSAEKMRITSGKSIMKIAEGKSQENSIYLMKKLANSDQLLIATLNDQNFWATLNNIQKEASITVASANGDVMHSTTSGIETSLKNAFVSNARLNEGAFSWNQGGTQQLAHFEMVDMHALYDTNNWMVVASTTKTPLLAHLPASLWLIAALLTLLAGAYAWLSLRSKKNLPLVEKQTAKIISLPTTKQEMRINQQSMALITLMGEIDAAILSNANIKVLFDLLFANSCKVIPAKFMAVTKIDKSQENRPITTLVRPNGDRREIKTLQEKSMLNLFSQFPNGHLVTDVKAFPFLQEMTKYGASQFLVHPVYRDGILFAVLYFGFDENKKVTDFEQLSARQLANRMGVARTIASRGKEVYQTEYYDSFTELLNRQACRERLSQEISRARRQQSKLAAFYIDLDGFKKINDSAGYLVGDSILKEAASRLKSKLREADIIARSGDDEFIVVVSDIEKTGQANAVADKILKTLGEPFTGSDDSIHLTASIGISIYPDNGMTADSIIHAADSAMTSAKKNGRGHTAFYIENMAAGDVLLATLEKDLRQAINKQELYMVYQPQFCSRTHKILGAEALMRWEHPERGIVSPMEFIKVAEESGMIVALGHYARKMVFEQYVQWQSAGVHLPKIAVNTSSQEIQRSDFIDEFKKLIEDSGMPVQSIELEITEGVLVDTSGDILHKLKEISEMGVSIAIDDFGTGYSNLSYLVELPFDVLKVDQSFVRGVGKYQSSAEIVNMIIHIAHQLGKKVCAEGVETEEQKVYLSNCGCETMQGYLYSKPIQAAKFAEFVQNVARNSIDIAA